MFKFSIDDVTNRNLQKYFTYKKDSKITKREYTNDTISSNLTILLRPEKSVVISEDDTVFVKTSKLNEYINKTTEYSKRDGAGRISQEGNGLVSTYIIDNSIIEDKNAVDAMKSFNSDYGLNVQPNALTTIKLKEFQYGSSKAGYEQYKFRSSTILNSRVLIPDPLANVTDDIINSINNIISKTKAQIGYENNLDIYDVIENFLIFIDINEAAKNIYIEGKKQDEAYSKAYKMKILSIILGIFGGLTLMLSPVEEIVANIILVAVDLIATDGIQGGLNSADIGWGIAGIFGSLLGLVKTDVKFIEMVKYVNKGKGYKEIEVFPHIKKARENFYGKVC
ncbi:hypothetical protein JCM33374_g5117 [Metschnikowia sp. JCM 33374]|nr:hypothetical protein JCM33374_g5117 [Metschnikowia sp. JCM 33374]